MLASKASDSEIFGFIQITSECMTIATHTIIKWWVSIGLPCLWLSLVNQALVRPPFASSAFDLHDIPEKGKSVWIYYVLCRRLSEGQPVILYFGEKCHLFVDGGVFLFPADFFYADFNPFMWTLVDSDEARLGVPSSLVTHGTRLFVIYVTSPDLECWSRLHKITASRRGIMNPWTEK